MSNMTHSSIISGIWKKKVGLKNWKAGKSSVKSETK